MKALYLSRKALCLISPVFLLFSCSPLTVRTEKINQKHLASYYAETPDPLRCRFFKGQQMVVSWDICRHKAALPFKLKIHLIRSSHRLEIIERILTCHRGSEVFYFLGDDWCKNGEILTWRAEIFSGNQLIACKFQKPWVDWIGDSN
ncbi:MAG: hypothetical protein WCN87_00400 [Chlamydiota bacterium]